MTTSPEKGGDPAWTDPFSQLLLSYFFSPFSRVAAFFPARTAGGAVLGLECCPGGFSLLG
jgi:hypothetical protein